MRRYRRIEDMHPEIKAFFESVGRLELDDEDTPEICFLHPHNGDPGYSIAMSIAEFRWMNYGFTSLEEEEKGNYLSLLCKGRPSDEWLYWGVNGWLSEEEMLRIIKLKSFI